ncbi:hypothetical protein HDU82_003657 [Entophlyctis luteolus]|nr:hypothetical protein HDU82_003657 [Entophlyctis luteolus]
MQPHLSHSDPPLHARRRRSRSRTPAVQTRPRSLPVLSACVATFIAAASAATTFLRRSPSDHLVPRRNRVSPRPSQPCPSSSSMGSVNHTTPVPVLPSVAPLIEDAENDTTAVGTSGSPQSASRTVRRVEQRLQARGAPDYNAWEYIHISPYAPNPGIADDTSDPSYEDSAKNSNIGDDAEDFIGVGYWLDFLQGSAASLSGPELADDDGAPDQQQDSCDSERVDSGVVPIRLEQPIKKIIE